LFSKYMNYNAEIRRSRSIKQTAFEICRYLKLKDANWHDHIAFSNVESSRLSGSIFLPDNTNDYWRFLDDTTYFDFELNNP
jgi:hypothetical protein